MSLKERIETKIVINNLIKKIIYEKEVSKSALESAVSLLDPQFELATDILDLKSITFDEEANILIIDLDSLKKEDLAYFKQIDKIGFENWLTLVKLYWLFYNRKKLFKISIKSDTVIPISRIDKLARKDIGRLIKIEGTVKRMSANFVVVHKTVFSCSQREDCSVFLTKLKNSKNDLEDQDFSQLLGTTRYYEWYDDSYKKNLSICRCRKGIIEDTLEHRQLTDYQTLTLGPYLESEHFQDDSTVNYANSIEVLLNNPLIFNNFLPGHKVKAIGILKTKESTGSKVELYLDILEIVSLEEKKVTKVTLKQIATYNEFAENNPLEQLVNILFSEVHGLTHIKEAITILLFSAKQGKRISDAELVLDEESKALKRTNSHLLLVGNPGCGKSKLLRLIYSKLNSFFINGVGVTVPSLTASAYQDGNNKWALDAGVLPLANNKIVCIDQIDKMTNQTLAALLEAMEQQTVTVSKAAINATFPAKFTLVAASNPRGKNFFKEDEPAHTQIGLPSPLLNRFDLIFVLRDDILTEFEDFDLVKVINSKAISVKKNFNVTGYLKWAKTIDVQLTKVQTLKLAKFFKKIATTARKYNLHLSIRHLEGLVRMVKALAKMHLRNYVKEEDLVKVMDLFERSVKDLTLIKDTQLNDEEGSNIIDPATLIVNDAKKQKIVSLIKFFLKESSMTEGSLMLKILNQYNEVSKKDFSKVLKSMEENGLIFKPDGYKYSLI